MGLGLSIRSAAAHQSSRFTTVRGAGALWDERERIIWVAADADGWQHRSCEPALFWAQVEPSHCGEVPERSNGAVSKTVVPLTGDRGFESLPLRQYSIRQRPRSSAKSLHN